MKLSKIQSSGKPGTELAALSAARKIGIAVTGWTPKDSGYGAGELRETPSTKVEQSIIWNVRDSHATLIFDPVDDSAAASLALEVASSYGRPYIVSDNYKEIKHWIDSLEEEITLNIIGPSEDEFKGIEKEVKQILVRLFAEYNAFLLED